MNFNKSVKLLLVSLMTSVFLAACATTSGMVLNDDVVVVDGKQAKNYWVAKEDGVSFKGPGPVGGFTEPGEVTLQYIIDSRGEVFNVEVIDSQPEGKFDRMAIKALSLVEFMPAEDNPERTPVQVTQTTTFNLADTR